MNDEQQIVEHHPAGKESFLAGLEMFVFSFLILSSFFLVSIFYLNKTTGLGGAHVASLINELIEQKFRFIPKGWSMVDSIGWRIPVVYKFIASGFSDTGYVLKTIKIIFSVLFPISICSYLYVSWFKFLKELSLLLFVLLSFCVSISFLIFDDLLVFSYPQILLTIFFLINTFLLAAENLKGGILYSLAWYFLLLITFFISLNFGMVLFVFILCYLFVNQGFKGFSFSGFFKIYFLALFTIVPISILLVVNLWDNSTLSSIVKFVVSGDVFQKFISLVKSIFVDKTIAGLSYGSLSVSFLSINLLLVLVCRIFFYQQFRIVDFKSLYKIILYSLIVFLLSSYIEFFLSPFLSDLRFLDFYLFVNLLLSVFVLVTNLKNINLIAFSRQNKINILFLLLVVSVLAGYIKVSALKNNKWLELVNQPKILSSSCKLVTYMPPSGRSSWNIFRKSLGVFNKVRFISEKLPAEITVKKNTIYWDVTGNIIWPGSNCKSN